MKVYEGRAVAHGRNIPFLPILEVFRSYFGIALDDDAVTAREKIAGRMVVLDKAFAEALPLVFDFLGVADPQRPAPRLDADARQRQLIAVMRQIIHSVNDEQPAITLVEDLHWMDESSAEFMEHMVDARAGTRSLLLLNFRPEYHAEWMEKSWYRQIPLTPLGRDAIAELLVDRLGSDPSLDGLATPIYERTGGNPFFAEEVAQTLIESGHLEGERGHYKLVTPIEQLEVPATVQVLLAARIDRLPEREKRLLQVASVIGKTFTEPLLAAVAELIPDDLKASLAALRRSEFIHEQAIYPVVEYSFKHPLTQEVAFNSQLKERRRNVHGAVARAIEEHHPDDLDERAALLAHHLESAGELAAAAKWHARAAQWTGRTDWAQGNWHWRRVLSLTDEGPSSPQRESLRLDAILQVFATGWRLRLRAEDVEPLFDEARQLCRALGDREQEAVLLAVWGIFRGNEGEVRHHLSLATEACALLDEGPSKEALANARMSGAYGAFCLGRFPEALEHIDESIQLSEGGHDLGVAAMGFPVWSNSCRLRGQILCAMGRFEDANAAIAATEDVLKNEPRSEVYVWLVGDRAHLGLYTGLDSFGDLRPVALEVIAYCERTGSDWVRTCSMRDSCIAHCLAEDWENAVEWGRAAAAFASEHRVLLQEKGDIYGLLALALRGAGEPAEAAEAATEGVEWSEAKSLAFQEAFCRIERAGALREAEGPAAAERIERDLERVAVLLEESGGRSLIPRLIEERARLAALRGEDARPGLQEALESYREIGAGGHAQRLAAELAV
jgi:adenylate cyclase